MHHDDSFELSEEDMANLIGLTLRYLDWYYCSFQNLNSIYYVSNRRGSLLYLVFSVLFGFALCGSYLFISNPISLFVCIYSVGLFFRIGSENFTCHLFQFSEHGGLPKERFFSAHAVFNEFIVGCNHFFPLDR